MWIKGWKLVVLTGRSLYIEELVIHKAADLGWPKPVLCCPVVQALPGLQAVLRCTHPLATGQTSPADCNEELVISSHSVPAMTPPAWPRLY